MKHALLASVLLCLAPAMSFACSYDSQNQTMMGECPQKIIDHVMREVTCLHIAGEEGGDDSPQRQAELKKAIADSKCTRLACDRQKLLAKYKGDVVTQSLIEKTITDITGDENWKNNTCAK